MTNQAFAISFLLLLQSVAIASQKAQRWPADRPDVRARFVDAIQRVQDEFSDSPSTMAEVREILGEPDDVITEEDQPLWPRHVIWCYGTAGHLSLPTLGAVVFDEFEKARWIIGGDAVTPAADRLAEPQLRDLLRLIDRVRCDFTDPKFNPRHMVTVVNTLRQLDRGKALGALREYSRVQSAMSYDGGTAAIIVMRFLFSVPNGQLHHTTYLPFEEYKSAEFPAFPAVVIDGVPLYIFPLGGWVLGGGLPSVDKYLNWYAENGAMIEQPLKPANDPRTVWEAWQNGLRTTIHAANPAHAQAADDLVIHQLLRLIDTVHARQFDENEWHRADKKSLWAQAMNELREAPCRWDEVGGRYVRAKDGSFIEPVRPAHYARVIWELPVQGRHVRLIVHRVSDNSVDIEVEQVARDAPVIPKMFVQVFTTTNADRPVTLLEVDGDFTSGTMSSTRRVQLGKGTELRAQLTLDNKVIAESGVIEVDREVRRAE